MRLFSASPGHSLATSSLRSSPSDTKLHQVHNSEFPLPGTCFLHLLTCLSLFPCLTLPSELSSSITCYWLSGSLSYLLPHMLNFFLYGPGPFFFFLRREGQGFVFALFCFLFIYLFIYLFIFGCVGSSFLCEGFLQLRQAGATLHCGARASHCRGLSCCGAQAPDAQAQ